MNKNGFVQIISHPNKINEQALKSLKGLGSKYPYSEVVHVMIAKGVSIQSSGKPGKELSIAALYSTDRSILKSVLIEKTPAVQKTRTESAKTSAPATPTTKQSSESTKTSSEQSIKKPASDTKPKAVKQQELSKEVSSKAKSVSVNPEIKKKKATAIVELKSSEAYLEHEKEMDALRDELFHNLEELQKSKSHFSELFDIQYSPGKKKSKTSGTSKKKTPQKKEITKTTSQDDLRSSGTKKPSTKSNPSKKVDETSTDDIDSETIDALIENLDTKRKEEDPGNDPQSDLSEPSVEFGDDLISENLAKIMIKQGKNDKAIDIYKKLIWKFPQKKAYFASQIENLKEE